MLGNPTTHHLAPSFYMGPMIRACGTRHIYSASTVDQMPAHVVSGLLWGDPAAFPIPDIDRTDHLHHARREPDGVERQPDDGAGFPGASQGDAEARRPPVVVDPRRSETAKRADEHLFIRAGDVFWLAAIAQTLFAEDLVDIPTRALHGRRRYDSRDLVNDFTPEAVADLVRIDAETTRRQARALAGAAAAAVYGRIGANTVEFGTATQWMATVLNILTGRARPARRRDDLVSARGEHRRW